MFSYSLVSDLADALRCHRDRLLTELSNIETVRTAIEELAKSIEYVDSFSLEIDKNQGRTPLGKVYVALPFNNPLYSLLLYGLGPVISGNFVVVRPSRLTAKATNKIFNILRDVLQGRIVLSAQSGSEFISEASAQANAFIFTGSWANLTNLEGLIPQSVKIIYCGSGLCAAVVMPDASMSRTVESIVRGRIFNSGQDCLSFERIFVHSDVATEFSNELQYRVDGLRVGANHDEATDVGPLLGMDLGRLAKHVSFLSINGDSLDCIQPSVIKTDKSEDIFNYEKFCPLFTWTEFGYFDDIRGDLEDYDYQMGASIYGSPPPAALNLPHVAYETSIIDLEAGGLHAPFGGRKKSGFVRSADGKTDGPILFSLETSVIR